MKTHLLRTVVALGTLLFTFASADARWIIYEGKSLLRQYPSAGYVQRLDRWMSFDLNTETGKVTAHAIFERLIDADGGTHTSAGTYGELLVSRPVAPEGWGPSSTLLVLRIPGLESTNSHFHITLQGRNVQHFPDQKIQSFPTKLTGSDIYSEPDYFSSGEWWLSYSSRLSNIANDAGMDVDEVIGFISGEMEKLSKKARKK